MRFEREERGAWYCVAEEWEKRSRGRVVKDFCTTLILLL